MLHSASCMLIAWFGVQATFLVFRIFQAFLLCILFYVQLLLFSLLCVCDYLPRLISSMNIKSITRTIQYVAAYTHNQNACMCRSKLFSAFFSINTFLVLHLKSHSVLYSIYSLSLQSLKHNLTVILKNGVCTLGLHQNYLLLLF